MAVKVDGAIVIVEEAAVETVGIMGNTIAAVQDLEATDGVMEAAADLVTIMDGLKETTVGIIEEMDISRSRRIEIESLINAPYSESLRESVMCVLTCVYLFEHLYL